MYDPAWRFFYPGIVIPFLPDRGILNSNSEYPFLRISVDLCRIMNFLKEYTYISHTYFTENSA